jgi:tRNA threonylcarbamoyladenosine biosynthesis protein TsaE
LCRETAWFNVVPRETAVHQPGRKIGPPERVPRRIPAAGLSHSRFLAVPFPMPILISHSPAETEALGERLGRVAQHGLVIALGGELGAGKTQFVRGLARGLGITSRVHSPTFTLVNEYGGGRLKLFHLDLYRLETPEQILSAGIEEFLPPDGVAVIEWAERLLAGKHPVLNLQPPTSPLPPAVGQVKIEITRETERRIFYDDFGV